MSEQTAGIVQYLNVITAFGAEWVLWLLVGLSVVSVAVILERWKYFRHTTVNFGEFARQLSTHLESGKLDEAETLCAAQHGIEAQVALEGLRHRHLGYEGMERTMTFFLVSQRQYLDQGLVILGTLGNNAPFIGLFGTVLGIIQAFQSLSLNANGGASVVMSGISEALIATAVGLFVALPAVIAFNSFQRIVKRRMANAQSIVELMMAHRNHLSVPVPAHASEKTAAVG